MSKVVQLQICIVPPPYCGQSENSVLFSNHACLIQRKIGALFEEQNELLRPPRAEFSSRRKNSSGLRPLSGTAQFPTVARRAQPSRRFHPLRLPSRSEIVDSSKT